VAIHVNRLEGRRHAVLLGRIVEEVVGRAPASRPTRLFFLHDQRKAGRHPSAAADAERLMQEVLSGAFAVIPYESPWTTVAHLGQMDLVLTTKLHVGVVARSLGVPVLAAGQHPKIKRFYQLLGEGDCVGDPEHFLRNGLPDRVLKSLTAPRKVRDPVNAKMAASAVGNRAAVRAIVGSALQGSLREYCPSK
jgi:polysaccharide pyruvyl transferase WcaK-like protein